MSNDDRSVIEQCNLQGLNQTEYAKANNLSLAGTKSKIQRARKKLKIELHESCKIIYDEHGNVCCFDKGC